MTDKASRRPAAPVIDHLLSADKFGTQARLAKAAGIGQPTISEKKGSANPLTYSQMRRILTSAAEFGVAITPDDFFPDLTGASGQEAA